VSSRVVEERVLSAMNIYLSDGFGDGAVLIRSLGIISIQLLIVSSDCK